MIKNTKTNLSFYEKHNLDPELNLEKDVQAKYFVKRIDGVNFKKGQKILDVGCGVGVSAVYLRDKYRIIPYGLDVVDSAIEVATKNGLIAKKGDLDQYWPLEDNFFDGLISVQVLEHVLNPDNFLVESKRVLKKNGILIITTPNLAAWYNRVLLLLGYQPFFTEVSTIDKTLGLSFTKKLTPHTEPLGHLHVFTLKALEDLLRLHGFVIERKIGGRVNYFPNYIQLVDCFFSLFPSLATDLIVIARKVR